MAVYVYGKSFSVWFSCCWNFLLFVEILKMRNHKINILTNFEVQIGFGFVLSAKLEKSRFWFVKSFDQDDEITMKLWNQYSS